MNINLKTKSEKEAVTTYLSLLYRFHKLSDKELEVTVELILAYFKYLRLYGNAAAAAKLYLEKESRAVIMENLDMSAQVFRNYLTTLKKKNVLQEGMKLNTVLVPSVEKGGFNINISIWYEQEQSAE